MADPRQLLRGGHTGGAGTDDRDFFAGLVFRRQRRDPTSLPTFIDDGVFDRFDADRIIVDAQRAGFLAWRGTNAAGKFGKIIGGMQRVERVFPVFAEHQIIPIGNDVVDRAAAHAKRNAAIHAARTLGARLVVGQMHDEFAVMFLARLRRLVRFREALKFHETRYFTHTCLHDESPRTSPGLEC